MGEDRKRTARTNVGPKQGVVACPGEQAMVRPRPESPPQYPGERRRGTDQQRPISSGAEKKRDPAPVPAFDTWSTAKFFSKEEMERYDEVPKLEEQEQTVSHPRAGKYVISISGARRRQRSSVSPSCYNLWRQTTAHNAADVEQ